MRVVSLALCVVAAAEAASADSIVVPASADNTLYEDPLGGVSNGAGQFLFAGRTASALLRRGVVRFDVSSIPAGSTINAATLTLHLSRSISGDLSVDVHRVLSGWGEGASMAAFNEGSGAPAEAGDATWLHTFFDGIFWTTAGGDFAAAASASQMVGFEPGFVAWTGAGLADDVRAWVDAPASNFGWLLRCDESLDASAKRFDSRENIEPTFWPSLRVDFTPPCAGDYDGDLDADFADITFILSNFNNPFQFGDITIVLVNFGNMCR